MSTSAPSSRAFIGSAIATTWLAVAAPVQATPAKAEIRVYVSTADLSKGATLAATTAAERSALMEGVPRFFCSAQEAALASGSATLPALQDCGPPRHVTAPGARLIVGVVAVSTDKACKSVEGRSMQIEFEEKKRQTLIGKNLKQVASVLLKKNDLGLLADLKANTDGKAAPSKDATFWCIQERPYILRELRSDLTVSASFLEPAAAEKAVTLSLLTGPAEHWFLSGDAIVRGADELKWDPAKRTATLRDDPNQLYLGFNYMRGDLYQPHKTWATERIVGRFMLQPSKRPFDAFGLGVGYRFGDGTLFDNTSQANGGFMAFIGVFSIKGDSFDANGAVVGDKRQTSWRFGVSYSLDALLKWIE